MKIKLAFSLLLFFISASGLLAQEKFEKEYRLKTETVPLLARQFVDSLPFNRRIKWYAEVSELGKTVEAKTKFERRRYSVEFDSAGKLLDVEIGISFEDIPEKVRAEITRNLAAEFEKFSLKKIQEQLTGTRENLLAHLAQGQQKAGLTTRYELIVKGSKDGEKHEFEFTFSAQGQQEKKAKLVFRNTDNLQY